MQLEDKAKHDSAIARTADALRNIYGGRDWLVAEPIVQAAIYRAEILQGWGAREVFALGAVWGSGKRESAFSLFCLDGIEVPGMMANLRAGEAALDAISEAARQRIDMWDPTAQARVIRAFYSSGRAIAGRATWGRRPDEWQALENKVIIDAIWDAAGVQRAASATVEADKKALVAAHQQFNEGAGTVWAADNREGWHGSASGIRWVHDAATFERAVTWAEKRADQVRVMPFLEGIPCSIHGIVFSDYVIALRPCEMLVLREPETGKFHYAQAATTWDPAQKDRQTMRKTAKRVGAYLRRQYGYRGVFTIDGVLTSTGFTPTELNPRFGAALGLIGRAVPEIDLYLLHLALVEGVVQDWAPQALECALLHFADHNRQAQVSMMTSIELDERLSGALIRDHNGHWKPTNSNETATVSVSVGASPGGSSIRMAFDLSAHSWGPPLGPEVANILSAINAQWKLGLPTLDAAQCFDG